MKKLIAKAKEVRKKAYAPYSKFKVGAALEAADGRVFAGCNVECASLGATCCAERVALGMAISAGVRKFKRIAIVADTPRPCPPCGICRQVLFEFSPKLDVVMANTRGKQATARLDELLPLSFRKGSF